MDKGVASLICIDEQFKKILLIEKTGRSGMYFLPGGKIEGCETPEEGMVREAKEEVGEVFVQGELTRILRVEKFIKGSSFINYFFAVMYPRKKNTVRLDVEKREVQKIAWIAIKDLLTRREYVNHYHLRDLVESLRRIFKEDDRGSLYKDINNLLCRQKIVAEDLCTIQQLLDSAPIPRWAKAEAKYL